ncbi:MAG: hypothetical protein IT372_28265, partial [Polyangiaceae bacterium]|nr:hypothetical protein [Polyangiaceae bacterium]
MENEIWVAGYPSFYGGADVELDHQIDLWRSHGVGVHLVPMQREDQAMRRLCDARGCVTHPYEPRIFDGKVVVSFCSNVFLRRLPEIHAAGAPRAVVWFNCMTWLFPGEIEAHKQGWITHFGFQTSYQRERLVPELARHRAVEEIEGYRPYFSLDNRAQDLRFDERARTDHFGCGRVSRDDAAKFSPDMWRIFDRVLSPRPKKVFILG